MISTPVPCRYACGAPAGTNSVSPGRRSTRSSSSGATTERVLRVLLGEPAHPHQRPTVVRGEGAHAVPAGAPQQPPGLAGELRGEGGPVVVRPGHQHPEGASRHAVSSRSCPSAGRRRRPRAARRRGRAGAAPGRPGGTRRGRRPDRARRASRAGVRVDVPVLAPHLRLAPTLAGALGPRVHLQRQRPGDREHLHRYGRRAPNAAITSGPSRSAGCSATRSSSRRSAPPSSTADGRRGARPSTARPRAHRRGAGPACARASSTTPSRRAGRRCASTGRQA